MNRYLISEFGKALLALFFLMLWVPMPTALAQGESPSISPREFFQSFSPAERKLPYDIVLERRRLAGLPVPEMGPVAGTTARSVEGETRLFKVSGANAAALLELLNGLGVAAEFVSESRAYAKVYLTSDQAAQLAASASISSVKYVVGPIAQGSTEAYTAHRVGDFAADPSTPTGNGVVVGLISMPFEAADLAALEALSPRKIPDAAAGKLLQIDGVTIESGGSSALLSMLQLIYDMAPGATVVVGSPGDTGLAGEMATLINTMVSGTGTQGDAGYIPPVNIIVDDLLFPAENPFEIDEVTEAVVDATAAGVIYITAAGDGGNLAKATSGTTLEPVNEVATPTTGGVFDEVLAQKVHQFGNDSAVLDITADLDNLCLFWTDEPGSPGSTDPGLLLFNAAGTLQGFPFYFTAPGGCTSEYAESNGVPNWPATLEDGFQVVVEVYGANPSYSLMVTGVRANGSVTSVTSPVFSHTTQNNIRGHAYHPDAVTVGSVNFCRGEGEVVVPFSDASCAGVLDDSVTDFSSDGGSALQERFLWESDGNGGYQALAQGITARKPDNVVAGESAVRLATGGEVGENPLAFKGTSASAAITAGIAALYWDYRNETTTGDVLAREVRAAIRDGSIDITVAGWDSESGDGIIDAFSTIDPDNLFEEPLPVESLALVPSVGGVQLSFDKSLDDLAEVFEYDVDCGAAYSGLVIPENSSEVDTEKDEAPLFIPAANLVACTVTPKKDAAATPYPPSALGVESAPGEINPVAVTVSPKAGGVVLNFAASPYEATDDVTYNATCRDGDDDISGWYPAGTSPQSETDYPIQAAPGRVVSCGVVVTVQANDVTYESAEATDSATAQSIPSPSVLVRADAGGVGVTWSHSSLADPASMASATLRCTNANTGAVVINNEPLPYGGGFVEAEAGTALNCRVTTTVRVNGAVSDTDTSNTFSVTPEDATSSGLPVWLLYIATQPQTVTSSQPAVGINPDQTNEVTLSSTRSLGQTFTAAVSGELTSITIYVQGASTSTAADLSLEIWQATGGLPSGVVALATEIRAIGDVPARNDPLSSTKVTFSAPATVVAGEEYAFLLQTSDTAGYDLWYRNDSAYADGASLQDLVDGNGWTEDDTFDFSFQVFTTYTQ